MKWASYMALGASMALVGSYVALSKPLLAAFPVFLLAWLRFGIGAIAMATWLKKPTTEPPLSSNTRWLLFLESLLGNFLFSICMLFGMRHTTAVAAGIILSGIPAVVAIMSWIFLKEKVAWRSWAGIACAAIGIALYSLQKIEHPIVDKQSSDVTFGSTNLWLGNVLIFAAVMCEAAYAVIGKKLTEGLGPKRISALINLWGLALITPLGWWFAVNFDFPSVKFSLWLLLIFYGLAASVWTVWLWMTGLKIVPANQAGLFTVMLPISAAVTGVVFLGEEIGKLQLLAFAIALTGVILATWPPSNRSVPSHTP